MSPTLSRSFLVLGLLALPLDFAATAWAGAQQPGYSHVSQYMSELAVPGLAGARFLMGWWIGYGVALVALALGLRAALPEAGRAVPILLALAGVGLGVGPAVFPCDAGCVALTPSGQAHQWLALAGCVALAALPFAAALGLPGDDAWRGTRRGLVVLGVLGLAAFGAQIGAGLPDSPYAALRGSAQRGFLALEYLALAVLAGRGLAALEARGAPAPEPAPA